jgi:hypothetical protein
MTAFSLGLAGLFVSGALCAAYAWKAPRKTPAEPPQQQQLEPWTAATDWTAEAGAEFSGLSESGRCDLVFAVADLNDDRSFTLLLHALDDPSDAVALAAGHVLIKRGAADEVDRYIGCHPGERAQRLQSALLLLG